MATYLTDLENTGLAGLAGLDELSANDKVIIFYGTRTGAIAFDKHVELTKAKAEVTYIKTERVAKNYLDFQLVTYLGYLIGSGQERVYYIISKDKGYDSCIEFWKKMDKHVAIARQESLQKVKMAASAASAGSAPAKSAQAETEEEPPQNVSQEPAEGKKSDAKPTAGRRKNAVKPVLPESVKKKIRKAVKDEELKGGSYVRLYDYMVQFSDKQKLNVALVKNFQQEKGNRLYKEILDIFVEYHKQDTHEKQS